MEFNFDALEDVPTSLMKDVTETPAAETAKGTTPGNISSFADHTAPIAEPVFKSENPAANNPTAANFSGSNTQGQKMNAGALITGDMAAGFLDLLLPVIIVLIADKVAGKKINKRYLQATPDEKKTIAPVLQNYLNSVNFNVESPLNALLLTCAFIYGTKTIEVLNMPDNKPGVQMPSPFRKEPENRQGTNPGFNKDGTRKKDGRGRPTKK